MNKVIFEDLNEKNSPAFGLISTSTHLNKYDIGENMWDLYKSMSDVLNQAILINIELLTYQNNLPLREKPLVVKKFCESHSYHCMVEYYVAYNFQSRYSKYLSNKTDIFK